MSLFDKYQEAKKHANVVATVEAIIETLETHKRNLEQLIDRVERLEARKDV